MERQVIIFLHENVPIEFRNLVGLTDDGNSKACKFFPSEIKIQLTFEKTDKILYSGNFSIKINHLSKRESAIDESGLPSDNEPYPPLPLLPVVQYKEGLEERRMISGCHFTLHS